MATTHTLTVHLAYWDQVLLRRLLLRARKKCEKDMEKQKERNWQPEPGKLNLAVVQMAHIDELLPMIPDPGPLERVTNVGGE